LAVTRSKATNTAARYLTGVKMRFSEFKRYFFEADGEPGYYTIGDSHAKGIADAAGHPWINSAVGGRTSTSPEIRAKVPTVTPGSIVVVAAGANDTANSYRASVESGNKVKLVDPKVIASNVADLVNMVKAQKPKKIIFLLFPNGKGRTKGSAKWYNGDYQEDVRSAIKSAVSGVEIIDQSGYPIAPDQIHSDWNVYSRLGKEIVQRNPLGGISGAPETKSGREVNPMLARRHPDWNFNKTGSSGNPDEQLQKEGEKFFIDVPTSRRGTAVRDVQQALEKLGYSVGPPGLDGLRGKYTIAAVRAFQRDNPPLEQDGDPGPETVAKLNAIIKAKPEKFKGLVRSKPNQVKSWGGGSAEADVGDLLTDTDDNIEQARKSAEQYLGRKMSDTEWTALLKVTAAEENNTEALGWVIGAILNRVKQGSWGDDVVSVLTAGGQFEPVTGTYDKVNKRWLGKGLPALPIPSGTKLRKILTGATEFLPSVPSDIVNFTSAIDAAYNKPGHNISYKKQLLDRGGVRKGNSIFAR